MDQQIGFDLLGGAEGQFHVGAVHRIARLERNHAAPAFAGKFGAKFGGSQTQSAEIIMRRNLHAFDFSADVPRIRLIDGVIGAGMRRAGAGKNRFSFGFAIGLPDVLHVQHGEHHAFGIAQRDLAAARRELLGEFFGDVERDGHGPENAAGQAHVVADAFVIGARHETAQRRKSAGDQQFQIADLAGGKIPRRPFLGMGLQFGDFFRLRMRLMSSPPCGGMRWLVEAVKC